MCLDNIRVGWETVSTEVRSLGQDSMNISIPGDRLASFTVLHVFDNKFQVVTQSSQMLHARTTAELKLAPRARSGAPTVGLHRRALVTQICIVCRKFNLPNTN